MEVEWRIEPQEGASDRGQATVNVPEPDLAPPLVRVTITHQLHLEVPVVRTPPGQWVVGELFVKAVASRTLACLKRRVEREGRNE
jgi:hypothetical protein